MLAHLWVVPLLKSCLRQPCWWTSRVSLPWHSQEMQPHSRHPPVPLALTISPPLLLICSSSLDVAISLSVGAGYHMIICYLHVDQSWFSVRISIQTRLKDDQCSSNLSRKRGEIPGSPQVFLSSPNSKSNRKLAPNKFALFFCCCSVFCYRRAIHECLQMEGQGSLASFLLHKCKWSNLTAELVHTIYKFIPSWLEVT